jgi:hypothetical protein
MAASGFFVLEILEKSEVQNCSLGLEDDSATWRWKRQCHTTSEFRSRSSWYTPLPPDHSPKVLRTGRCAKSGSLLAWCESMTWSAPQNASSLSPLAPKGDHMCPLSQCRSKSAGSQEGLHGSPFSLAHLMICHGPQIGCLHIWGSQSLCSHVEAALFHRDER